MNLFYTFQDEKIDPLLIQVMIVLLIAFILIVVLRHSLNFIEIFWVEYISSKPFYRHFYLRQQRLNNDQLFILKTQFSFYDKLKRKEKKYFEHRVANFIKTHEFTGKSDELIDDQKEILISATAIMLTFGYRDYQLNILRRILVYPSTFYSNINKSYHKGEFNPSYRAIVFSWEDFLQGYEIDNDNFNLGIHEFVHAMHFEFISPNNRSISAIIFMRNYNKLKTFLKVNKPYKNNLIKSKYLRNYAFTNNFEFIAVLIESFIETPLELKSQFPEMYDYVRKMLNFNFSGY